MVWELVQGEEPERLRAAVLSSVHEARQPNSARSSRAEGDEALHGVWKAKSQGVAWVGHLGGFFAGSLSALYYKDRPLSEVLRAVSL